MWGGGSPCGSQRPHLNDINFSGIPRLGGHIKVTEVIAGDDEDDGGGAEGHLLLGSVPAAARLGHDDWPDGALDRSEGPLFEAALQPREPRAEQLQQTAAELREGGDRSTAFIPSSLISLSNL